MATTPENSWNSIYLLENVKTPGKLLEVRP